MGMTMGHASLLAVSSTLEGADRAASALLPAAAPAHRGWVWHTLPGPARLPGPVNRQLNALCPHPPACSGQQGGCAAGAAGGPRAAVLPAAAGERCAALRAACWFGAQPLVPPAVAPVAACPSGGACPRSCHMPPCKPTVHRLRLSLQPAPPPPKQKAGSTPPTDSSEWAPCFSLPPLPCLSSRPSPLWRLAGTCELPADPVQSPASPPCHPCHPLQSARWPS